MHDRNNIKWAPFNSVINGSDVLKEINEEKSRVTKPVLSEDQLEEIENKIFEAMANESTIELIFYKNNHFYKTTGKITNVSPAQKKITINHKNSYYFSNIIKIIIKNT